MKNNSKGQENRAHPRWDVTVWVQVQIGDQEIIGRTSDLSMTGAALEIESDVNTGDRVHLNIKDVASIDARVVRPETNRIALEFEASSDEDTARLTEFLKKLAQLRFG